MTETQQNETLARFMGWTKIDMLGFGVYTDGEKPQCTVANWNPHQDLNQLFQVVDRIREKGFEEHSQTDKGRFQFWFTMGLDCFFFEKDSREQAIYTACLAAVKHLEEI